MTENKKIIWLLLTLGGLMAGGCKSNPDSGEKEVTASTPVTVTTISNGRLKEYIELNATSVFQRKSVIRSTATGFVSSVNANPGDRIYKGGALFSIITKEAAAMKGKRISDDESFHFDGEIKIQAQQSGIVSSISHHQGDYVQEGDELASIAEPSSLVFYLQVPLDLIGNVRSGQHCEIILPNGEKTGGMIGAILPSADLLSQAMSVVVKPAGIGKIPENLISTVRIVKSIINSACILPKDAILTDETQTEFWVMKLINDTVAVKTLIQKGIEEDGQIEIIRPKFQKTDRIILTGNYGLEDTAKVIIVK